MSYICEPLAHGLRQSAWITGSVLRHTVQRITSRTLKLCVTWVKAMAMSYAGASKYQ
jgi:hypothetical protein